MTLGPRAGGARARSRPNDRFELRRRRRSRRRSPRTAPPAARPIAIVATVGTTSSTSVDPVAAIADIAEREGLWLHVDAAYAGAVAIAPGPARAVRGLGARRLDRRQPAQVAVHAARRVAPAQPPDGRRCGPRSASCPSTCGRSTGAAPGPRLQRVHAAARPADAGAQAVDAAALVRARRAPAADRATTSSWPRRSPAGSTPTPDWERLAPGAVLDGLLPPPCRPALGRDDEAAARRPQRRADGRGEPDRRGVPVATPGSRGRFTIRLAIGNLRTERAPRRAGVGAAARGRRATSTHA